MVSTSHDLILRQSSSIFLALHCVGTIGAEVFDIGETERTSSVLVSRELGCEKRVSVDLEADMSQHIQMAVSALSAVSNWTTPVPLERPFGSY